MSCYLYIRSHPEREWRLAIFALREYMILTYLMYKSYECQAVGSSPSLR